MRVGEELVDVVDRRGGDLGASKIAMFSSRVRAPMKSTIGASQLVGVAHPVGVGAKPRVGDHVLAADRAEQPLRHRLDRGGDADVAPVLGAEDVAREVVSERLPVRGRIAPVSL